MMITPHPPLAIMSLQLETTVSNSHRRTQLAPCVYFSREKIATKTQKKTQTQLQVMLRLSATQMQNLPIAVALAA